MDKIQMFWKIYKEIIIVVFLWILASFFILFILNLEMKDKIDAWAVTTLVFVTLYYAIQTHKLVQEGKRKSDAEFWARAIEEFYVALLDKVKRYLEVFWPLKNLEQKISLQNEISRLINVKGYMISKKTQKRIQKLSNDFLWVDSSFPGESIEKAKKSLIATVKIINDEKNILEDKLRKFYEVEKKNEEKIKKRKKS